MVAELFLQETRPAAVAIANTGSWFANFTVGLTFPYILVRGGREEEGDRKANGLIPSLPFPPLLFLFLSPMQKYLYPYGTLVYTLINSMFYLFFLFYLPETKGKSVAEITAELRRRTQHSNHKDS